MICNKCGTMNGDLSQFCSSCAQPLEAPSGTSGKAVASLVLGFFSFIFPAAIAAVVLGHISRTDIRNSGGRLKGEGMALTGLIFGYMGVAIIPVLIIAAIAIPNLLRSRIAANEASAVGSLRMINTAESAYQGKYPNVGFACELSKLGGDGSSAEHAGLIDSTLTGGQKYGYRFELSCDNDPDKYNVVAFPVAANSSGQRSFCTNQTGIISYSKTGTAEACLESGEPLQ